jgi:RNA polymerase sigma-70 factor (ECF subfamily)
MLMDNYERIKRYITYKAGSEQAEDLTQQVFLQASKNMESFRNESSLYTWLYSIATNTIINEAKRCCNRKVVLTNELPRYITTDFTGDIDFKIDLGTSIDKLERIDQEILNLRYIADYSFRDIAKLLQINESTLKNRLYRCLGN